MKLFQVTLVDGSRPAPVLADYWVERDGTLILLVKQNGQYDERVGAFTHWRSILPVDTDAEPEDKAEPGGE